MGRRRPASHKRRRWQPQPKVKANHNIKHKEVRVIGPEGENLGVLSLEEALKAAKDADKDLVEISEKADPPVTRIMDVGKYLYRVSKKEKKQKQKGHELKSIRIKLGTGKHDQEIKAKKIDEFLEEGNPVEIRMFLRGRERANKDFAKKRLLEFTDLISVPFKVTMEPKYIGNGFAMQIARE